MTTVSTGVAYHRPRQPGKLDAKAVESTKSPFLAMGNCILWLPVDLLSGFSDTDHCTGISDLSGAGNHFGTNFGGGPIYRTGGANGKPYLSADGSYTLSASGRVLPLSNFSLYLVCGPTSGNNGRMVGFEDDNEGAKGIALYGSAFATWVMRGGSAGDIGALGTSQGTVYLFTLTMNGSGTIARVNRVDKGSNAGTTWADAAVNAHLFSSGSSNANRANAVFYEMVLFSAAHSTTDRDTVETALMTKYGLT